MNKHNTPRDTVTVYAIENSGRRFRVAGYDRETALKVVNDYTVRQILKAEKLIAIDRSGAIIAQTEEETK